MYLLFLEVERAALLCCHTRLSWYFMQHQRHTAGRSHATFYEENFSVFAISCIFCYLRSSGFVSFFLFVLNILIYTQKSTKFKFTNDSIIESLNTWATRLCREDHCSDRTHVWVALMAVLLFRAKEYICLGLAVITVSNYWSYFVRWDRLFYYSTE